MAFRSMAAWCAVFCLALAGGDRGWPGLVVADAETLLTAAPEADGSRPADAIIHTEAQRERSAERQLTTLSPLRDGFRWIFDGKSLKGWHKNPKPIGHGTGGQWTVENGAITGQQDPPGSGNGGILLTDETFKDVEIYFEVKIDWGCDSGFFLRGNEKGQCFQVMVDYHDNGNIGQIYREGLDGRPARSYRLDGETQEKDGRRELKNIKVTPLQEEPGLAKPTFDVTEWNKIWKPGEWNELRVKITGNPPTILTWLNGRPMTKYTSDQKFEKELGDRGHLAVQVHGGAGLWPKGAKVQYRNIQVRELK